MDIENGETDYVDIGLVTAFKMLNFTVVLLSTELMGKGLVNLAT